MKPVRRVTLHNTSGTSNKVYEVELLEGDSGGWVVVARWGRIGANLKEGTKTDGEVTLARAESVFDDLLAKKLSKSGYFEHASWDIEDDAEQEEDAARVEDEEAPAAEPPTPPELPQAPEAFPPGAQHPRCVRILERLAAGDSGEGKLSRAVWRAGELMLVEAEPLIRPLIRHADAATRYSALWSLTRFGKRASLATIEAFESDRNFTKKPHEFRLIAEARRAICADMQRIALKEVVFVPVGSYRSMTSYRRDLTGRLPGFPILWNLRRA